MTLNKDTIGTGAVVAVASFLVLPFVIIGSAVLGGIATYAYSKRISTKQVTYKKGKK